MSLTPINPPGWKSPIGYSNAMLSTGGRILFLAGQVAFDADQQVVGEADLTAQFEQVMKNLQTVVETANGTLTNIARMTIFVQDKDDYIARGREIGDVYRSFFGNHYPAMTLVEIARFYEPGILIEIEATAVLDQ